MPLERVPTGSYFSGRNFKICKWVSFRNGLGASQTAAFVQGFRMGELECKPLKSGSLLPALWFSWSPTSFKAIHFRGLSLQCRYEGLECFKWGTNPLLLRGNLHVFLGSLLIVCHCAWRGDFGKTKSAFSHPSQCTPFILVMEELFSQFSGLFQRKLFHA